MPTGAQFHTESKDWLQKQKATILQSTLPQRVQDRPTAVDRFTLEVEMSKQKVVMVYLVTKETNGGATVAVRLLPDSRSVLEKEVEAIARSVTITKPLK